jgi:predicted kinase
MQCRKLLDAANAAGG